MLKHSDPLNPKKEAVSMSSNVNKYTLLNNKSTKKEIAEAFSEIGVLIQPFHGIRDNGTCTCKLGKNCTKPSKQSYKKKPHICSVTTFVEILNNQPLANVGFRTGLNPASNKKFIVLDVDDPAELPWLRERIPSIDNTFTIKTTKGFHFYFLTDANNYITRVIRWDGRAIDILGGCKHGVIGPNGQNNPKSILKAVEMAQLSHDEIKTLETAKTLQNQTSVVATVNTKSSKKLDTVKLVTAFYKNEIKRGSYNDALFAVACKELRAKTKSILNGSYTVYEHITFLKDVAAKYLDKPTMSEVELIAHNSFKGFKAEKTSLSFEDLCTKVFKYTDSYTGSVTLSVIENMFGIVHVSPTVQPTNSQKGGGTYNTVEDLQDYISKHLAQAGAQPYVVHPDKLMRLIRHFHPELKKIRLDKIINGKRITKKLWNIAPTTTSILEPSSASTVRPNVKDEQVPASELESPVEAPMDALVHGSKTHMDVLVHGVKPHINFSDNLEEIFRDLLLLNQTIELNKKGH